MSGSALPDILCGRQISLAHDGQGIVLSAPPGFPGFDYEALQSAMLSNEQAQFESIHEFVPGLYLRRTSIPAGALVLGKRHKKPCVNLLLSGSVILFAPNGDSTILHAPRCFFGPAGAQKVAFTLSDVVCANVFSVEGTTIEAVEAEVFE